MYDRHQSQVDGFPSQGEAQPEATLAERALGLLREIGRETDRVGLPLGRLTYDLEREIDGAVSHEDRQPRMLGDIVAPVIRPVARCYLPRQQETLECAFQIAIIPARLSLVAKLDDAVEKVGILLVDPLLQPGDQMIDPLHSPLNGFLAEDEQQGLGNQAASLFGQLGRQLGVPEPPGFPRQRVFLARFLEQCTSLFKLLGIGHTRHARCSHGTRANGCADRVQFRLGIFDDAFGQIQIDSEPGLGRHIRLIRTQDVALVTCRESSDQDSYHHQFQELSSHCAPPMRFH